MAATVKHRKSSSKKRRGLAHRYKAELPQLVKTEGGKLVPAHTVTPANPVYKGIQFLRRKVKKSA